MTTIKNKVYFFIFLSYVVLFVGCSAKAPQNTIQKVYIPIKCDVKLPAKPLFNPADPDSLKRLIIYYIQIENLLKGCINGWF